jgi:hypothetical protein
MQELEATATSLPLKSRVYQGFVALALILPCVVSPVNRGWTKKYKEPNQLQLQLKQVMDERDNKLQLQLKQAMDERDAMKFQIFELELTVCPTKDELDALKLKYEDLFQAICVNRDDYRNPGNLKNCFDHLARMKKE